MFINKIIMKYCYSSKNLPIRSTLYFLYYFTYMYNII
jgi:hypothetical protein